MGWEIRKYVSREIHSKKKNGSGRTASISINITPRNVYEVNGVVIDPGFQGTTHVIFHREGEFKSKVVAKRYLKALKSVIDQKFFTRS